LNDFVLVPFEGFEHLEGFYFIDLAFLTLFGESSEDVIFDSDDAGSLEILVVEIREAGGKSELIGSESKVERSGYIFAVVLFNFLESLDETLTIFSIFLVAELQSHFV
jgi:hypothetical protein